MATLTQDQFFGNAPVEEEEEAAFDALPEAPRTVTQQQFFGDPQPDEPGFVENVQTRLGERREQATEIFEASDEQTGAETALQLTGKVGAGGVLDVAGEALTSAAKTGVEFAEENVPGFTQVTEPIRKGVDLVKDVMDTEIGRAGLRAAQQGLEAYEEWAAENPRAARNIESVVNIGALFAPVKTKAKAATKEKGVLKESAEALEEAAEKQVKGREDDFLTDLARPQDTKAVRTEQAKAGRVEETGGLLRQKKVVPTDTELETAEVLRGIEGVSQNKTMQGNLNAIQAGIAKKADDLTSQLQKSNVEIDKKEFLDVLEETRVRLGESPVIVGDAQKSATKMLDKMKQIVGKNDASAAGLLKARKEFDNWVRDQKPNAFDPRTENALTTALRDIRQTTNDFIAQKVPDVDVKQSLREQSLLYRAVDNIGPKAADEASNVILRAWQRAIAWLPFRGELNQLIAAGVGVGGLGASAIAAPAIRTGMVAGGISYALGRAVIAPATKRALGLIIRQIDEAIDTVTDKQVIQQLRADRAAVVELAKGTAAEIEEVETEEE